MLMDRPHTLPVGPSLQCFRFSLCVTFLSVTDSDFCTALPLPQPTCVAAFRLTLTDSIIADLRELQTVTDGFPCSTLGPQRIEELVIQRGDFPGVSPLDFMFSLYLQSQNKTKIHLCNISLYETCWKTIRHSSSIHTVNHHSNMINIMSAISGNKANNVSHSFSYFIPVSILHQQHIWKGAAKKLHFWPWLCSRKNRWGKMWAEDGFTPSQLQVSHFMWQFRLQSVQPPASSCGWCRSNAGWRVKGKIEVDFIYPQLWQVCFM